MIISRTPYRVSFFGGGTDYPVWYQKYGGQVLSSSIDKYVYVSCRYLPPFFAHHLRIVYGKIELCNDVDEIKHPSVQAVLKYLGIKRNLEIHYDGDLPARSGIGSSSAFTVGLFNALSRYKGIKSSKLRLAKKSQDIEQNIINETIGSQDQVSVAYGGFNHIKFKKKGGFDVSAMNISSSRINSLEKKLMLFHTGIFRTAESVTKSYVKNFDNKIYYLQKINSMVDEAINILKYGKLNDFGRLLNETWLMKKSVSKNISNHIINEIYDTALSNGALGGKLLGAGGGGFMIFYVPESKQAKLKKIISNLLYIPFRFENNGSLIIYSKRQKHYDKNEYIKSQQKIKSFKELEDL